jgi:hypothetical protein
MNVLLAVFNFLSEVGRIRAAAYLAHRGDYAGARRLTLMKLK